MAPALPLPEVALTLALAVIASSAAPLLLLNGDCKIVVASRSFAEAFSLDPATMAGRSIYELGDGEWDIARLRSLLSGTLSGSVDVPAYELDLLLPGKGKRRLVLNAQKLSYDGESGQDGVRMLLAVADVTDVRRSETAKDDLLREKSVLIQEIQHRVANSLQIIASVLMQSARKVGSEESRHHLRDAHSRVMAIAELQRQLAESAAGKILIRGYLVQLCQSIAASMIEDHERIQIEVSTDDSHVAANISVSLGLVVTELVINALKHAFPEARKGRILVEYNSNGDDWMLSVTDNGVGIDSKAVVVPGLGTNIVKALARHLQSEIDIRGAGPGTIVALNHVESKWATGAQDNEPAIPADPIG